MHHTTYLSLAHLALAMETPYTVTPEPINKDDHCFLAIDKYNHIVDTAPTEIKALVALFDTGLTQESAHVIQLY